MPEVSKYIILDYIKDAMEKHYPLEWEDGSSVDIQKVKIQSSSEMDITLTNGQVFNVTIGGGQKK